MIRSRENQWPWPHFSLAELQCHCGCGQMEMDMDYMTELEWLRREYQLPMRISSAYRCPAYNASVSSTGANGPHTTGKAVDVIVHGGNAWRLLGLALNHGFTGIGVHQSGPHNKGFIHLDRLVEMRPWLWTYPIINKETRR